METNWAAEHLQTIRTLMERSALYRRALAPLFCFVGAVGIAASVIGWKAGIISPRDFAIYWMAVGLVAITGALLLVRRQALKSAETFWSAPTRRIAQAMAPALLIGLGLGLTATVIGSTDDMPAFLVVAWTLLYGLALHAAGFFVSRGVRLFGWLFVLDGLVLWGIFFRVDWRNFPHLLMGLNFGLLHLLCGIYLYFSEQRKNET